jgi:hypothetical protein
MKSRPYPPPRSSRALLPHGFGHKAPGLKGVLTSLRALGGVALLTSVALVGIALSGLVVVAGAGARGSSAGGSAARSAAVAGDSWVLAAGRAAHVTSVKDEGHLHMVSESGSNLLEEGPVSGTIPGRVKVSFNVGPTVRATFTIYPSGGGSISGRGQGSLHSTGLYASFGGSLTVTDGTGRYAHAHGSGGLYGVIDRKTYALTVQTVGKLDY